jgi:ketosteroid isomerase-like protein
MTISPQSGPLELLYRFSEAVDHRRAEAAAACFTADAIFQRDSNRIVGSADILALYRERMADPRRKTTHVWSNAAEIERNDDGAVVTAILTNYAFEPTVSESDLQMRVGRVRCLIKRNATGEWQFAEHLYENAFAIRLPL